MFSALDSAGHTPQGIPSDAVDSFAARPPSTLTAPGVDGWNLVAVEAGTGRRRFPGACE